MRKVVWSPSASADLKSHVEYIKIDSPSRAAKWAEDILRSAERLARFPKLGRSIPEIGQSRYRELIIGEYRLFHEMRERDVLIFRILHCKRLFDNL